MTQTGTATKTAGQQLADTLRKVERIGTRTRRYRGNLDLHEVMLEVIANTARYPGCWKPETEAALAAGYKVWIAWTKHVDGYRIDPVLRSKIAALSPWQLAKLLGQMVDAGVTNTGEGEIFFANLKLA